MKILSFQCDRSSRLQEQYTVEMNELGEHFKLVRSDMSTLEHDLTSTNELFQRLIQQSTPLQNEWQQAEKKLSELKMTLEQKQSLFQQNSEALGNFEQQKAQTKEKIQLMELQLETLHSQLEQQTEHLQHAESETQQRSQAFTDLKAQQLQAQQQYEQVKVQVEKQQQQKAQMQAQIEQLAKNVARIEQQKDTLKTQAVQVQSQFQTEDVQQLEQDKLAIQAAIVELEQKINQAKQQFEQLQESISQQKTQISALKSDVQVLQSEQKNLTQLMAKSAVNSKADTVQLMQVLTLNAQGKAHAPLVEKFLAKWLSAHIVDQDADFAESVARQLKATSSQDKIQLNGLACLADWIESPQYSLWNQVAVIENLAQALAVQAQLKAGQSILTLDGYHVGQDWVIGLFFDESSQAAQGALSHRIRLEEIETQLAQLQPQLIEAETVLPNLNQQLLDLQKTDPNRARHAKTSAKTATTV